MPLLRDPLLRKPCCAPAARDLGSHLYIKHVPPAVRKPTAKDSVVVSLLLVRYQRPSLLCKLCHLPRLCPHPHNLRSARIPRDPGSLLGIEHVIAVASRKRTAGTRKRVRPQRKHICVVLAVDLFYSLVNTSWTTEVHCYFPKSCSRSLWPA